MDVDENAEILEQISSESNTWSEFNIILTLFAILRPAGKVVFGKQGIFC